MMALRPILLAALAYWGMVFALAFVLGAGRTLWLAPRVGDLVAVACEVPLTLIASWLAARHFTRRFAVHRAAAALTMGLIAFAVLMLAELALAQVLSGLSPRQWISSQTTAAGALGLAGQVAFGLMPWWVRGRGSGR